MRNAAVSILPFTARLFSSLLSLFFFFNDSELFIDELHHSGRIVKRGKLARAALSSPHSFATLVLFLVTALPSTRHRLVA